MKKELIYDNIQKSISYVDGISLAARNNQIERYEKNLGLTKFESIRLTI